MNIKQIKFPLNQYIQEEHDKVQIYLHHTAGNPSGEGVFNNWALNKERIATCVTISGIGNNCEDGQIIQGYDPKYWAFHLGLKESTFQKYNLPYKSLDKISIGIEICNWGQLTYFNGKYYNYVNKIVPDDQVYKLNKRFKGFQYFHNYTDKQIESVKELLLLWKRLYNIDLTYKEDIWDITQRALKGNNGVFTHNSVRYDKTDVYPHDKLIEMLKKL